MAEPLTVAPPSHTSTSRQAPDGHNDEVVDWADLAGRMWDFLTGREAAIHYTFDDLAVEVPRDTGPTAPRATWKLQGTVTVTTSDRENGA